MNLERTQARIALADRLMALRAPKADAVVRARSTLSALWLDVGDTAPAHIPALYNRVPNSDRRFEDAAILTALGAARIVARAARAARAVRLALRVLDAGPYLPSDSDDHRRARKLVQLLEQEVIRRIRVHKASVVGLNRALRGR